MTFNRRDVLRKASATGTAGLLGSSIASPAFGKSPDGEGPDIQTTGLSRQAKQEALSAAFRTRSFKSILGYLHDKRAGIRRDQVVGRAVSPPGEIPEYVVLNIPIEDERGTVSIRLFDDVADVTAVIDEQDVKSNPAIRTEMADNVIPVAEWHEYRRTKQNDSDRVGTTSVGRDIDIPDLPDGGCVTKDFGTICIYFAPLVAAGVVTAAVVPEPSSTAAAAAYTGTIVAGQVAGNAGAACGLAEIVDRHLVDGCNANELKICIEWDANVGWSGITYEVDTVIKPVDC
jgi:hypothetical protein